MSNKLIERSDDAKIERAVAKVLIDGKCFGYDVDAVDIVKSIQAAGFKIVRE